jgi:hypothetical protein
MTKGVQFVHESGYALQGGRRTPTKAGGTTGAAKAGARAIIGEAIRESPEYHRHVPTPKPAVCLYGKRPEELIAWYNELVAAAAGNFEEVRAPNGKVHLRPQKKTTKILIAAVFSYPGPASDADADYVKWRLYVTAWAKRWYGTACVSILEHWDEKNGHIHVLAHAQDGLGRPVAQWQVGEGAAIAVRQFGGDRKAQGRAYKLGCQHYQDAFWRQVGKKCGLERISAAPKPRLPYVVAKAMSAWKEVQEEEEAAMQVRRKQLAIDAEAAEMAQAVHRAQLIAAVADLKRQRGLLDQERSKFVNEIQAPFLAFLQAIKATLNASTKDAVANIAKRFGHEW